jgi:iron complex outermembrane receptor protein
LVSQIPDTVNNSITIGYTEIKDSRITGAISYLRKENFNKGYILSSTQLLQGKVAGLSVSKPGGNPNLDFYTRIRGLNTIYSFDQPLFVIDGIPGGYIENLDPDDIESVTILKDAASCSVYGIRGSAGVILITTRSGNENLNRVSYNSSVTLEDVAKNVPVLDAGSWRSLSKEMGYGTDFGFSTDWYDEIEQNAISQMHNLAAEGGTDKTSWRFALNYRNINGILRHSGYEQLNGRISLTRKVLNDRIRFDIGIAGTEKDINYSFDEAFHYAPIYNPTAPVRSESPENKKFDGYFQEMNFDYYNPVSIIDLNKNQAQNHLLEISVKASVRLAENIKWETHFANQEAGFSYSEYFSKYEYLAGTSSNGVASRAEKDANTRLFETILHYSGTAGHSVDADIYAGYSFLGFIYDNFSASVNNFIADQFTYNNLGAAASIKNGDAEILNEKSAHRLASFFSLINLSWRNWLLNGSYRYEGSSRLGINKKWAAFPSIGLAYSWRDHLKFRISYGVTGNIPKSSYTSLELLQRSGQSYYYDTQWVPIYDVHTKPNPDLQAERKHEWDFGIDFAFFNSKFQGTFDYYKSTAKNLLLVSRYDQVWFNGGEIQNSGKELTLNYTLVNKEDFSYRIKFNAAWGLKSKLVSLTGVFGNKILGNTSEELGFLGSPGAGSTFLVRAEEGEPVGQMAGYVYDGIDPSGDIKFKDLDNNGWIDQRDIKVSGNGLPKSISGLGQSVTYKNWNLDIFFRGVFGHYLLNSFRAIYESADLIRTYNIPEDILSMKNDQSGAYLKFYYGRPMDIYIEKASFIALDHVTLSYLFKSGKNHQNKIAVYASGNNLFYLTRYKGADPNPRYIDNEDYTSMSVLAPGIDRRTTWSRTRSFTLGFRLTFD